MIKRISLLIVAAIMAVSLVATAAPAFAASASQRECEAAGGTFSKEGPTPTCVFPEVVTPPKNERQADKFVKTSQTTDTGQGTLKNKPASSTTSTCGTPCPPGQFK